MHQLHIIADKQVLIINITRNDVNRYISKLRFFLNDLYIHVIVGILVQFIGKKNVVRNIRIHACHYSFIYVLWSLVDPCELLL